MCCFDILLFFFELWFAFVKQWHLKKHDNLTFWKFEFLNFEIMNFENSKLWNLYFIILRFWKIRNVEIWNIKILQFWTLEFDMLICVLQILKFWHVGILRFRKLTFWNFEMLKIWNCETRKFEMLNYIHRDIKHNIYYVFPFFLHKIEIYNVETWRIFL